MKLLYCSTCQRYTRRCRGTVFAPDVPVQMDEKGDFWLWQDGSFSHLWGDTVDVNLDTLRCRGCEGQLVLVEMDECPHVQDEWYWKETRAPTVQECRLCGWALIDGSWLVWIGKVQ